MLRAHSFVKVVLFYNNWSSFFLMVDLICLQFPLRRILMTTSQTDLHFFWSGFVPVMTCGWQRIRHGVVFQSTKKQKWPLGPSFQSTILESVFALWQSDSEYVFIFLLLMLNFEKNHAQSTHPTQDLGPRSLANCETYFASILAAQMRKKEDSKKN